MSVQDNAVYPCELSQVQFAGSEFLLDPWITSRGPVTSPGEYQNSKAMHRW